MLKKYENKFKDTIRSDLNYSYIDIFFTLIAIHQKNVSLGEEVKKHEIKD